MTTTGGKTIGLFPVSLGVGAVVSEEVLLFFEASVDFEEINELVEAFDDADDDVVCEKTSVALEEWGEVLI